MSLRGLQEDKNEIRQDKGLSNSSMEKDLDRKSKRKV